MHKPLYKKDGSLKHSNECKMAFDKKDKECPRCVEMLGGSQPRDGFQKDFYIKPLFNYKDTMICCGSSKEFGICVCET